VTHETRGQIRSGGVVPDERLLSFVTDDVGKARPSLQPVPTAGDEAGKRAVNGMSQHGHELHARQAVGNARSCVNGGEVGG
jgi:hypothetical protein